MKYADNSPLSKATQTRLNTRERRPTSPHQVEQQRRRALGIEICFPLFTHVISSTHEQPSSGHTTPDTDTHTRTRARSIYFTYIYVEKYLLTSFWHVCGDAACCLRWLVYLLVARCLRRAISERTNRSRYDPILRAYFAFVEPAKLRTHAR